MNGTLEDYDEALAEDYDEMSEFTDDEAEFIPGVIGNILNPLQGLGIMKPLIGAQPSRPPLPRAQVPAPGSGVRNATLSTPAGQATIALPEAVARQDEFRAVTASLKTSIDRNTDRLNTVTADVKRLSESFVRIETDTRAQVAKLRTDTRNALVRAKKNQSSQQTTNLMMTLMMQQQMQSQFNDHKHIVTGAETEKPTGTTSGNNSMMFMLLPMLMTGDTASSNDMMLPMMMMMVNQNK